MSTICVTGLQWGDEGKGKIVDILAERSDYIVRFHGGNNAGHTIVIDGKTYKLSLLPSGILREGKIAYIGPGVVVDIEVLLSEISMLQSQNIVISAKNLKIADNATIILDIYKKLDETVENLKGDQKIGTTKRGIGFAYQDKSARRAIRVCDLFETDALKSRITEILTFYSPFLAKYSCHLESIEHYINNLTNLGQKIKSHVVPSVFLQDKLVDNNILFEGAQGAMLDNSFGTYPYVTSSNTISSSLFSGSGIGIANIDRIIGVLKAYTTRVGEGPFMTEDKTDVGAEMQKVGKEFGTVTGRIRRCGALDLVSAKHFANLCGINEIVLTKLDVLSNLDEISVCTAYSVNGVEINHLPSGQVEQASIVPVYTTLRGWKSDISNITNPSDLPVNAVEYIRFISKYLGIKISIVSVGQDRLQTIYL